MDSQGPLAGLLVLDFSRVLTGPHCGRVLLDLGADVIKVEPPAGDMTRYGRPRVNSLATYFVQQNVGKRNVSLDLDRPQAADLLVRLVGKADVLIENFRPGVMDRMGLGYDRLVKANLRLIYASITGYGQEGPWRHRAAYAPTIHAEMGLFEIVSRIEGRPPRSHPFSHADLYAGLQCAIAILAALHSRERTGRGDRIDVSLAESLLFMNESAQSELAGDFDRIAQSTLVRSPTFRTKAGGWVHIAGDPRGSGLFRQLYTVMQRPELAEDPRFSSLDARVRNEAELLEVIQEWILTFDNFETLEAVLDKGRIAIGAVRTVTEAADSPWAKERGAIVEVSDRGEGTIRIPNTPFRFASSPTGPRGVPAYRGEHNREVFRDLVGLTDQQIDDLEVSGVLTHRGPSEGE